MALDQVTKAMLSEFLTDAGLRSEGEPKDFEKFCAHVVIRPSIDSELDFANVISGDGNDTGLDAVAIVVNGQLITDPDVIDELAASGSTLDVTYIFTQSELDAGFSTSKIGQILFGIGDFFAEAPRLRRNDSIQAACEISQKILSNPRLLRNSLPKCYIYYATAGRRTDDADLQARRAAAEEEVDALNLFSAVKFTLVPIRELQRRHQDLKTGVEREFNFPNRIPLPEMRGVREAHLGFLPAKDFLDILTDDEGEFLATAFYDNVRAFQGVGNSVNSEISATLVGDKRHLFPVMNNGVTVIAKDVRQVGMKFFVQGFQIVNGCQTCNVLWSYRDHLSDEVLIPLKLISTTDEAAISDIIRATNRQTEVKPEQFLASTDYIKHLEAYFDSTPAGQRLYLERRLKQYVGSGVEGTRIIPFNHMVRAFASIVLREPHKATKNYKQILELAPVELFHPEHRHSIYHASASALYWYDYLLRNKSLDRRFSPAKYHLLLATSMIVEPRLPRAWNGKEADAWSKKLCSVYWDLSEIETLFHQAAADIEALAGGNLTREEIRTAPFTEKLIRHYSGNR